MTSYDLCTDATDESLRDSDDGISHFRHQEVSQRNVSAPQGLDGPVPRLQVGRVRQWECSPMNAEGLLTPIMGI